MVKIKPFGNHLSAHKHLDFAGLKGFYDPAEAVLSPGRIQIHSCYFCFREQFRQLHRHLLDGGVLQESGFDLTGRGDRGEAFQRRRDETPLSVRIECIPGGVAEGKVEEDRAR